jgi:hypothetical protein
MKAPDFDAMVLKTLLLGDEFTLLGGGWGVNMSTKTISLMADTKKTTTVSQLYRYLQEAWDDTDMMSYSTPTTMAAPGIMQMQNGWHVAPQSIGCLSGGSIEQVRNGQSEFFGCVEVLGTITVPECEVEREKEPTIILVQNGVELEYPLHTPHRHPNRLLSTLVPTTVGAMCTVRSGRNVELDTNYLIHTNKRRYKPSEFSTQFHQGVNVCALVV